MIQKLDARNENFLLKTLSVTMPDSKALASVNKTASTRRAAILRQASETVVPSGMVSALDNLSFLTVLSPPTDLQTQVEIASVKINEPARNQFI